jgi:hypothetical protein
MTTFDQHQAEAIKQLNDLTWKTHFLLGFLYLDEIRFPKLGILVFVLIKFELRAISFSHFL